MDVPFQIIVTDSDRNSMDVPSDMEHCDGKMTYAPSDMGHSVTEK